ncbi:MAG TPA: hypothetical protein VID74_01240 [Gemmatimonadales bacterium]|jgi:hypothetical protein
MRRCAGRVERGVVHARSAVDADAQTGILLGIARDALRRVQRSSCRHDVSRRHQLRAMRMLVGVCEAGVRTVRIDGS